MDDSVPNIPPLAAPAPAAPILSYLSSIPGGAMTVGRYTSAIEAALPSSELAAEGIPNHLLNANINALGAHFASFTAVELQVHESDAARAREILERINADDLEPAAVTAGPPLDEKGEPMRVLAAGAFERVREMRDAQTVLASAGIAAFPPALVRRGDLPAGTGRRFVLRVHEEDLERARALLSETELEGIEDDDPRCPKCHSWRIYPVSNLIGKILSLFAIAPPPENLTDCLACGYRGPTVEFNRSSRSARLNLSPGKKGDSRRE